MNGIIDIPDGYEGPIYVGPDWKPTYTVDLDSGTVYQHRLERITSERST